VAVAAPHWRTHINPIPYGLKKKTGTAHSPGNFNEINDLGAPPRVSRAGYPVAHQSGR